MALYDAPVAKPPLAPRLPPDDGFDELDEAWLRAKPGAKWAKAGDGVIPCWIADMDFPTPRPVREALGALADAGDLGYASGDETVLLEEKWAARMADRFRWSPQGGRFQLFCDVVQAVQVLVDLTTSPGDGILLLTPSYPPLWRAIEDSGRRLLAVPAFETVEGWAFDLDLAEEKARRGQTLVARQPPQPDRAGACLSRTGQAGRARRPARSARRLRRGARRPRAQWPPPCAVRLLIRGVGPPNGHALLGQQVLQPRWDAVRGRLCRAA